MRRAYSFSGESYQLKIEKRIPLGPYEAEILWRTTIPTMEKPKLEDIVDEIIYWDENKNMLYVEAIAYFKSTKEFVKFRKDIVTELDVTGYSCPVCSEKLWNVKEVDAKTVVTPDGKRWKCFSLVFICKKCNEEGRISGVTVSMLGFKYAFSKFAKGIKDFFERLTKIVISADLRNQTAEATMNIAEEHTQKLTRCPLLG